MKLDCKMMTIIMLSTITIGILFILSVIVGIRALVEA